MGMAYRRLFFALVFCSVLTEIFALQCYLGTDRQCTQQSTTGICTADQTCQCAKYRFQCTANDQLCSTAEQSQGARKWAYTILSKNTCQQLKQYPNVYLDLKCCSTDGCNRPSSGRCSWSQSRRRDVRKLTDLIDF